MQQNDSKKVHNQQPSYKKFVHVNVESTWFVWPPDAVSSLGVAVDFICTLVSFRCLLCRLEHVDWPFIQQYVCHCCSLQWIGDKHIYNFSWPLVQRILGTRGQRKLHVDWPFIQQCVCHWCSLQWIGDKYTYNFSWVPGTCTKKSLVGVHARKRSTEIIDLQSTWTNKHTHTHTFRYNWLNPSVEQSDKASFVQVFTSRFNQIYY